MAGVETLTAITSLTSAIAGLLKRIGDKALRTELNDKIIDLQSRIMDAQTLLISLQDENAKLRTALDAPGRKAKSLNAFDRRGNAYWKDNVPFCVGCLESDREPRSLVQRGKYSDQGYCPACKNVYPDVFQSSPLPKPEFTCDDEDIE